VPDVAGEFPGAGNQSHGIAGDLLARRCKERVVVAAEQKRADEPFGAVSREHSCSADARIAPPQAGTGIARAGQGGAAVDAVLLAA
jgi:hypothetical protein